MEVVNTAVGFADAIAFVINYCYNFIRIIFPSNISLMFGIAFTVIVAIGIKRGVLA